MLIFIVKHEIACQQTRPKSIAITKFGAECPPKSMHGHQEGRKLNESKNTNIRSKWK